MILSVANLPEAITGTLIEVQHDLFDLGGELCIPGSRAISAQQVTRLETTLDAYNDPLPALKEFILPGGGPAAAACHLARTIARRAERRAWTLAKKETVKRRPYELPEPPVRSIVRARTQCWRGMRAAPRSCGVTIAASRVKPRGCAGAASRTRARDQSSCPVRCRCGPPGVPLRVTDRR